MPTLADIYSAIGSAKRRAGDVLANPYLSAQQMLGFANDRARVLNEMTAAAAQEGVNYGPATQALGQTLASAYNPVGMTVAGLTAKYPNVILDIAETPKAIDLSRIVVPKELRGQGIGSSVMQDLINYADESGKQVRLSPTSDFGGSVSRLKDFYKNFGFVENKGRNKDFTTRETMIRLPQTIEPSVSEYGMAHRPMTVESGAARLHDLTKAFDDTIYSKEAIQNYGTGVPALDREAIRIFQQVRNKPDAMVTVYRAVPKDAKQTGINPGDWISVSKQYAMEHGEGSLGGNYKIVSQKIPAAHITTNADSILEQGYYPQ